MRLVFIHGWGFDATIWNGVIGQMSDMNFAKVELGFLGKPITVPDFQPDDILIGHSLGFLWGATQGHFFTRWVAVNGFAHFVQNPEQTGCIPLANLRAMRRSLTQNPGHTLQGFHELIGSTDKTHRYDVERLEDGLKFLEETDLGEKLLSRDNQGLILAAQDDPLVPVVASEYLAGQGRTVDVMWKAGGHLLPITEPQWCAREIEKFLKDA